MNPVEFKGMNCIYGPPPDFAESQVMRIPAYHGEVERGSVEGAPITVVAWRPSPEELARINEGAPIFLSMLGGLAPHFMTTDFEQAIRPA